MRVKVSTIDRLALLCISVLGAALAVIGGAIALAVGGAILGLGLSMMALAVFYAILMTRPLRPVNRLPVLAQIWSNARWPWSPRQEAAGRSWLAR